MRIVTAMGGWLWSAVLFSAAAPVTPGTLLRDFDRDGVEEKLTSGPGVNLIQRKAGKTGEWEKADFTLPEGVTLVDDAGHDAGLRFVDLNGDGFDDLLLSNEKRYAIHLWNTSVRLDLGWTKGWSQFVREGKRTGANSEPPSLVGAKVRIDKGELIIERGANVERLDLKQLIAFDIPPAKSPAEALASFHVRAGFKVELVAAEPLVVDPIAFDWGADGRLWVVEMRDYPQGLDGQGKPGGVVKILEDPDGDGRCDKVTVFLDGITFPSSVMPWRKGALIAAAPDLFYAEDTNGDGRADARRVLFTGFTPGNQQHRFNGFEWGLDGWVYCANGDSGGRVKSLTTGETIPISGRDIRVRPDTGEVETVSAQTQFGRRRDDWGNWFGNNNPTWLWHVTFPEHYLRRNPRLALRSVKHVLANYENPTRVFPASAPMVRPNQPWSLNHVTSACSPCPYRDELFGPEFATSVFISEPVHNCIHREVLERDGPGFSSHRAAGEEASEFLASTDNWFRPVTIKTGPDGALYLADMYRFVIEHPEWISAEMQARLDLRAGEDKGRIYRVVPDGKPRRAIPNLAKLNRAELATALNNPNGWQRDMAQRLLVERGERSVAVSLQQLLAVSHAPQVRVQALATLGLLRTLSTGALLTALNDPHPAMRCEALRQSEWLTEKSEELFRAVAALVNDGDPGVRVQAAFSLGAWPPERSEPVLRELAARPDNDELVRLAILSSVRPDSEMFRRLNEKSAVAPAPSAAPPLKPSSPDRAQVIADYAGVEKLAGDPGRGKELFQLHCAPCHRLRGEGHEVGPDLGMVGNKPVDWLLTAILDPNQAVEARFRAWQITLKDGDDVSGLISAETANNLVVRQAGGLEHAILRSDIATIIQSQLSLMPTGFESALKTQDMADLLGWLRGP